MNRTQKTFCCILLSLSAPVIAPAAVNLSGMQGSGKADPAIYPKLRELALKPRAVASGNVAVVLMDWQVPNGTASVMASADGSASIYLSSGGGFIGGGQNHTEIRESALHAIALANQEYANAPVVTDTPLPPSGTVYFYFRTNDGLHRAEAKEAELRSGINPLSSLGNTMQQIVTRYRLMSPTN